jgi:hypothetical protein
MLKIHHYNVKGVKCLTTAKFVTVQNQNSEIYTEMGYLCKIADLLHVEAAPQNIFESIKLAETNE